MGCEERRVSAGCVLAFGNASPVMAAPLAFHLYAGTRVVQPPFEKRPTYSVSPCCCVKRNPLPHDSQSRIPWHQERSGQPIRLRFHSLIPSPTASKANCFTRLVLEDHVRGFYPVFTDG